MFINSPLVISDCTNDIQDEWPAMDQLVTIVMQDLKHTLQLLVSDVRVGDCREMLERAENGGLQFL